MRVLILAKDYDPSNLVAAKRPAAWRKYLPDFGIDPVVVTSTPGSSEDQAVFRVDSEVFKDFSEAPGLVKIFLRKLRSFFEWWLPYLSPRSSRLYPIYKEADRIMQFERFDCVIASGEPFVLFCFAALLSKKHRVPWCADYRDNWSNNTLVALQPWWYRISLAVFYKLQERRWIKTASLITAAAPSYLKRVKRLAPSETPAEVLLNGHDLTFQPEIIHDPKVFRLGYAGRIYEAYPIESFFAKFREFMEGADVRRSVRFVFYGLSDWPEHVKRIKHAARGLEDVFEFRTGTDYDSYIQAMAGTDLFVLFNPPDHGWLNAKIFDYLALGGDVLLYKSGRSDLDDLIGDYSRAHRVRNDQELLNTLNTLYRKEPISSKMKLKVKNAVFSRKDSTAKLALLLKALKGKPCVE